MSLDKPVALVTGSSRGIGAAVAIDLAKRGYAIAVHGRDRGALDAVVAQIIGAGGDAYGVVGDVTDLNQVEQMREAVEANLGPVDVLVANAGGSFTPPAALEDIPEDGWRRTVDGNLTATFLTLKVFLPGMKHRGRGAVVCVSSSAGRKPDGRAPIAYGVAKAAIALLVQDVAAQTGPYNVRVNGVAPETIMTERNLERIPADIQQSWAEAHPLRRLGTPEDVATAVAFLVSEEASWITGHILDVAGGAVMA